MAGHKPGQPAYLYEILSIERPFVTI